MKFSNFVYGDTNRIFVNTDMGCRANCKYCYLPLLDIVHGERKISASQAIELVENTRYYEPGETGSIISIGCYSECMDKDNIMDTIALVKHFIGKKNYVQLATKKKIEKKFFYELIGCGDIERFLWIFVSLPTITNSEYIEPGTDFPLKRMENFNICRQCNCNGVLYIKPYLVGYTNQDMSQYCSLIAKYDVPVVVGGMLSIKCNKSKVMVGEGYLSEYNMRGMKKFIQKLERNTEVYLHSIDCIRSAVKERNVSEY